MQVFKLNPTMGVSQFCTPTSPPVYIPRSTCTLHLPKPKIKDPSSGLLLYMGVLTGVLRFMEIATCFTESLQECLSYIGCSSRRLSELGQAQNALIGCTPRGTAHVRQINGLVWFSPVQPES